MIVLALDTALAAASVAVLNGDQVLAALSEPMQRGHQERIAGLVREGMAQAGLGFDALDRIVVTVGPGSFTGLRVGLAFAKGLALALKIPCVGVGTLTALALSAGVCGRVAALVDARRDQVYLQTFLNGAPLTEPQSLSVRQAQEVLRTLAYEGPVDIVGSGVGLLEPCSRFLIQALGWPDPVALARLGMQQAAPPTPARPLYLRAPDAKTIAERQASAP